MARYTAALGQAAGSDLAGRDRCRQQYGVYATAKALRLDYSGLNRRTLGFLMLQRRPARRKPAQPAFLELLAQPATKVEDCVVEFESTQGAKMRVQWKASAPPDWPALLRAWCVAQR